MTFLSSKLILLPHQNVKIEKALSVVRSYFWFILNTINSHILVNVNFSHFYIVHYEDGNSNLNILSIYLFDDLNGFQSYSRTEMKHIILECIIIVLIRTN